MIEIIAVGGALVLFVVGGVLAAREAEQTIIRRKYDETIETYFFYNGPTNRDHIKLDFEKFKTFYLADPKNWEIKGVENNLCIPTYEDKIKVYFVNVKEYEKFLNWARKSRETGEDYANTEAVVDLVNMISANVQKRIDESTLEAITAYESMATILDRINEERSAAHEPVELTL